MSYIRTKDGIYKLIEIRKNEYRMLNANGTVHLAHYEPEDYKIADTIEELIDEFVLDINNVVHQIILGEFSLKEEINIIKRGNKLHKVYGAIWTDKGLIYVAKMNEDGELILI